MFTFKDAATRHTAQRVHDLSRDLRLIEELKAPRLQQFLDAPRLEYWSIAQRIEPALSGVVSNHPLISDGQVLTSGLFFLDEKLGYARTLSRWYQLGKRLDP